MAPSFILSISCAVPSAQVRNTILPFLASCPHELTVMVSRSTAHRHALGDRINRIGELAMVSCQYCAKKNLECRMSSLKKECGNCYRNGVKSCVPVEIPVPNFEKLDQELARLEQQEADADAAEAAALQSLMAARAKKDRLRKQRKMLKRREQQWVDGSGKYVEEIEALEAMEGLNRDVAQLEGGLMPGTLALDWSAFMPSALEGDPGFDEALFGDAPVSSS
jgi:hypothetical protein